MLLFCTFRVRGVHNVKHVLLLLALLAILTAVDDASDDQDQHKEAAHNYQQPLPKEQARIVLERIFALRQRLVPDVGPSELRVLAHEDLRSLVRGIDTELPVELLEEHTAKNVFLLLIAGEHEVTSLGCLVLNQKGAHWDVDVVVVRRRSKVHLEAVIFKVGLESLASAIKSAAHAEAVTAQRAKRALDQFHEVVV